MQKVLGTLREMIRAVIRQLAKVLNRLSGGRITPNSITITSLLGHLPIAWLIITNHYWWAAGLLVVFGLMDTLDGELARLQKRASNAGMLLDASTDRIKEVILYSAIAYNLISLNLGVKVTWVVVALGASLSVSYIKAKGETAVVRTTKSETDINRLFQGGLLPYELRMILLILGLISGRLTLFVIVIAVLASLTALQRLFVITRRLSHV